MLRLLDLRLRLSLCLALLYLSLLGAAAAFADEAAPPAPRDTAELEQQLVGLMQQGGIPGASVVLYRDGQPLWSAGLGLADRASGRPVTPDTGFRIGSITKSLVAIAVMQQVERGRLRLDDAVHPLVPELPIDNPWQATDPVRVVHLLEHTAGFDDMHFRNVLAIPGQDPLQEMLRFDRELRVRWRPGERHSYSNPGYGVLGLLLHRSSGRPLRQTIDEDVLAPLGMHDCHWTYADAAPTLATGYRTGGDEPVAWEDLSMPAAGNLVCSAASMERLLAWFLSAGASAPGVLRADSLARIERSESTLSARAGLQTGYGLGNWSVERGGRLYRGHSGGTEGYYANFNYSRELGTGFVLLTNVISSPSLRPMQALLADFAAAGHPVAEPEAVAAADPQWNGWYQKANTRNSIDALDELVNVGYVSADGDRYRFSSPLFPDSSEMIALAGNRLRDPTDHFADGALAIDADGRRALITDDNVFVQRSWFAAVLPMYAVAAGLLLLIGSLLFAPVWLLRGLLGRFRDAPRHGRRLWPLLAAASLAVAIAALLGLSLAELTTGTPNLRMWLVTIGSAGVAVFGAIGLLQGLRRWSAGGNRWARLHSLAASLGALAIGVWLWQAGLLGLRLWAW